jgi:hypothetical protein
MQMGRPKGPSELSPGLSEAMPWVEGRQNIPRPEGAQEVVHAAITRQSLRSPHFLDEK